MGVPLNSYGGITASAIKARTSIPGQSDITVLSGYADAKNIQLKSIAELLGESPAQLTRVHESAAVNKWSKFSSRYWILSGGVLVDELRSNYDLGVFAGYNHNAQSPYIGSHTADFDIYEGQVGTLYFLANIFLGEIAWMDVPFLKSINMEVTINGSFQGVHHIALNSSNYLITSHSFEVGVNGSAWTGSKAATLRFYFGKDEANGWQELASIPGIGTETVVMTMKYKAKLRSFTVSDSLKSTLGGSAEIVRSSSDIANCYVTQLNNGLGSVTLACHGIDTNGDGVGDLNIFNAERALWFKKNNEEWIYMDAITLHIDSSAGGTYFTIFSLINPNIQLTWEDNVDIEIR